MGAMVVLFAVLALPLPAQDGRSSGLQITFPAGTVTFPKPVITAGPQGQKVGTFKKAFTVNIPRKVRVTATKRITTAKERDK